LEKPNDSAINPTLAHALADPNNDQLWENYIETCRRLDAEPVPRERACEMTCEWAAAFERREDAALV
jgi:hypothetical protein